MMRTYEKIWLLCKKKCVFVPALVFSNALNRSNNRDNFLFAHLILSIRNIIWSVGCGLFSNIDVEQYDFNTINTSEQHSIIIL